MELALKMSRKQQLFPLLFQQLCIVCWASSNSVMMQINIRISIWPHLRSRQMVSKTVGSQGCLHLLDQCRRCPRRVDPCRLLGVSMKKGRGKSKTCPLCVYTHIAIMSKLMLMTESSRDGSHCVRDRAFWDSWIAIFRSPFTRQHVIVPATISTPQPTA